MDPDRAPQEESDAAPQQWAPRFALGWALLVFYPTFVLRLLLPTDVAMTWSFILHVFLAGVFSYVFLRACGLGFVAALAGGLAYAIGGNVAGLVSPGHDGKLYISALLPLTLLLVLRGVHDGRRWAWGMLAIVIGLAVLSPHPQLLQYLLLVAGAFALYVAFGEVGGVALQRRIALRRLGSAAVAVIVGGAIGAIQYLPVREYVPFSPRAGGKGWEHAVSYSMPPEELFNMYLPQFTGVLDNYWGRNGIHFHSEYLGAVVLLLAGLGLGATIGRGGRKFVWFWLGVFVVALLWAMGGYTPFYRIVYAVVPGTKFFRAPSTMLYVVSFSVAVLAACGLDRVLRRKAPRRYLIGWLVAGALMAVLGVSGLVWAIGARRMAPVVGGWLTNVDSLPIPGARRVVGPVTNAAGTTVYLFEMPGTNPLAWLAPVIAKAVDDQVLSTVLDPRFDVRRAALFDTAAAVTARAVTALPQPFSVGVTATSYEPGQIGLALDAPAPEGSALVVSENYYPGWSATVDGRPAPIGRANYAFIGVELPPGGRNVVLSFDSAPYHTGKVITLGALAVAAAWWVLGAFTERRRRV